MLNSMTPDDPVRGAKEGPSLPALSNTVRICSYRCHPCDIPPCESEISFLVEYQRSLECGRSSKGAEGGSHWSG